MKIVIRRSNIPNVNPIISMGHSFVNAALPTISLLLKSHCLIVYMGQLMLYLAIRTKYAHYVKLQYVNTAMNMNINHILMNAMN